MDTSAVNQTSGLEDSGNDDDDHRLVIDMDRNDAETEEVGETETDGWETQVNKKIWTKRGKMNHHLIRVLVKKQIK
jgi:hypothetical protein